jgi:cytochrome c551
MTKRILAVLVATLMTAACGGGDEEDPKGNPPGQQTTSGLSTSFQSVCATCHGDEGRGKDKYPSIPGKRDEAAFITIVRRGRGEMPAQNESVISDADLKSDYLWLTTKRQ